MTQKSELLILRFKYYFYNILNQFKIEKTKWFSQDSETIPISLGVGARLYLMNSDFRMNLKNQAEFKTYNLRALIKGLLMGDYINLILKASPLKNEINNVGQKLALTNCNIFDGLLPELKKNMTLLMVGDKIFDVGHCENITIPNDFYVIDIEGQTLLPGFIDSHVHECSPFTYNGNVSAIRQMPLQVALNNMRTVYSGVTTVCDMGGPQGIIKEFTKLAEGNLIPGPRFLNCYTLISPKKGKNLGYPTQVSELNFFNHGSSKGKSRQGPRT